MISKKVRQKIFQRDGECCVVCGTTNDLTIHHRVNRGAGGSKLFDSYPYLLLVCTYCNSDMESSLSKSALAKANGYKLSRNANPPIDPTEKAVYYYNLGEWYLLDNNGEKHAKH